MKAYQFKTHFLFTLTLLVGVFASSELRAGEPDGKEVALIVGVEGGGSPKVRRRSGIESVAGINSKLLPGDRVITDKLTTISLSLSDGTLIKVGRNSEYKVESNEKINGIFTWVFSLTKGSIRALVERSPDKKTVKFRVNTPVGTMGVRGTELIVSYNDQTKVMEVYTLEGKVFAGFLGCEKGGQCTEVPKGQRVVITREGKQVPAIPFNAADAMGFKSSGESSKHSIDPENNRIDLFVDAKLVDRNYSSLELKDISKMLGEAQSVLQKAQNDMLDRTEETRKAMNQAIEDGTYLEKKAMGEAVLAKADVDASPYPNSGLLNAKKFSIGDRVVSKLKLPQGKIRKAGDLTSLLTGKKSLLGSGGTGDLEKNAKEALDAAAAFMDGLKAPELPPQAPEPKEILADAVISNITSKSKSFVEVYKKCHDPHIEHMHCDSNYSSEQKSKIIKIGNEYYMASEKEKIALQKSTNEKIDRKNGECFKTVTVCEDKLKSCNTSSGAFCKPEVVKNCKQTQTAEKVACP